MHHSPRRPVALLLALAATLMVAAPVGAWTNGPPVGGVTGNGYGTHDWIIDQALKTFSGKVPTWFEASTARLASDDPDTLFRGQYEHVYMEAGYARGAVHQIVEYYDKAVTHLKLGDTHQASIDIGWLAHFYGDIFQPFHTAYASIGTDAVHLEYELLVGSLTKNASSMPEWQTADRSPEVVSSIRSMAIAGAAYSRAKYPELYAEFTKDRTVLNARVRVITGYVLKRASRELGDIIHSIDLKVGNAPVVAKLAAKAKYPTPDAAHDYESIFVTVTDAAGHPIEGAQVDVTFPASAYVAASPAQGTQTFRAYSMPDGVAKATAYIDPSLHGKTLTVYIKAVSRGRTIRTTTTYTAK